MSERGGRYSCALFPLEGQIQRLRLKFEVRFIPAGSSECKQDESARLGNGHFTNAMQGANDEYANQDADEGNSNEVKIEIVTSAAVLWSQP